MQILNIAGYKFIKLQELDALQAALLAQCTMLHIKGTLLLSEEGINLSMAGTVENIHSFRAYLLSDTRFADMSFRESYSEEQPFRLLKVKVKKEIITLYQPQVDATKERAPSISPDQLKQWLDEHRDITLLDTRNDFEVGFGTFEGAINLHLDKFSALPAAVEPLAKDKPVVMFCTGGIRCEKAALYMLQNGFPEVYQLDGGILNYFAQVGRAHYQGECFVFDERVAVNESLTG